MREYVKRRGWTIALDEALQEPAAIERILRAQGEATTVPPRAPARAAHPEHRRGTQASLAFDVPAPDEFDQTDRAA